MRVTFEAGAEVDVASPAEVRRETEAAIDRALRAIPGYKRLKQTGVMPSSGALVIQLGAPPAGTAWDVRRVVVTPADVTSSSFTSDQAFVFTGPPPSQAANPPLDPLQVVEGVTSLPATFTYSRNQCPVQGAEQLWVAVVGATADTVWAATALVIESQSDVPEEPEL